MKLELKHLAPYLPYGLKMLSSITHEVDEMQYLNTTKNHVGRNDDFANESEEFVTCHNIGNSKPILRPLSDLELDEFNNKIFNREYIIDKETDADLGYYEWCFLFSEHFDVFGLIEAGLAIDINTLEQ